MWMFFNNFLKLEWQEPAYCRKCMEEMQLYFHYISCSYDMYCMVLQG